MRTFIRAALVVAAVTAALPANAQGYDRSYTTRIETRPYYGATVTMEAGVRVFRALPPTRHMIINPHGATPLQLGINDTRIFENSTSHNHFYDHTSRSSGGDSVGGGGFVSGTGGFGHGKFSQRRHARGGHIGRHSPRRASHGRFHK